MPCPDPSRLAAYADRLLDDPERAGFEAHLADCPDCLGELRTLLDLDRPSGIRNLGWRAAAAAALLISAGALAWPRGPEPRAVPAAAVKEATFPAGTLLEAADRTRGWALRDGPRVALAPAGRLQILAEDAFSLLKGRAWIDVSSVPVTLHVPGGKVEARDAELAVALPAAGPGAGLGGSLERLLRSAEAGEEPPLEVLCRRGTCRVTRGATGLTLSAGQRLTAGSGAPVAVTPLSPMALDAAFAWAWGAEEGTPSLGELAQGISGLSASFAGEVLRLKPVGAVGHLPLGGMPSGDCSLELSVKPMGPGGDVGLAFPAATRSPYWFTGTPLPANVWTTLKAERRGGRVHLWLDGVCVSSLDARAIDAMTPGAEAPALGLWGAEVEVKGFRRRVWRPEAGQ